MTLPGSRPTAKLASIVRFLDEYLRIQEIPDESNAVNGLQVENDGEVSTVVAAVDASLETIGALDAAETGPVLLVVHHGLLWEGNIAISGRRYRRLRALLDRDAALYSAHIPLDVHPEVGNNVQLARLLGMPIEGWFGNYRGIPIGVQGTAPARLQQREALVDELSRVLPTGGVRALLIPGGPEVVHRVGIVTGAGGRQIADAAAAGLDTFISGEGTHPSYFDAMESGVNVIYAGHYATESLGVQALARTLADRFGLAWAFHDHPTGM